ncbi:hypothetical protein SAMN05444483_11364 [Salegentibacter echinorum]|uniref:HTH cro/C1-type domain-containing protein n=1 Tax=Salegentibacter echinorum TaxID=1073325 RepID=A0A1M5K6T9_SALEC|nr:helix-turn-helix domain-containing protein [Salegentibacter echinorum]SHG48441.1 hypothetical protein SAMN05444483_11364 [Salegentibacter echinorum]
MSRNKIVLLPKNKRILETVGESIKLAHLRPKLTMAQVSERAGISRPTLPSIEDGSSAVSLGIVLQVLLVLGLEKDFLLLAANNVLGRKIQDPRLTIMFRGHKR